MRILFAGFATVDIIHGKKCIGGAAGSLSINATKLGYESSLLTVLSKDDLGTFYIEALKKARVDFSLCNFDSPSLPICIIENPFELGSKRIWSNNGSLGYFDKISISPDNIKKFDAIFLVNALPDFGEKIAVKTTNRKTFYTPGPQTVLKEGYINDHILQKTKVIFGNQEEAPLIMSKKPFSFGVEMIVLTEGKHGGIVLTRDGQKIRFTAPEVKKVVDPTGAGDNFMLGFSLALLEKGRISNAVEKGKKLAQRSLKQFGTAF